LSISSNSEKFFHQNLLCWRVITLPNPNICISRALNDFLTYSTEPIIVTYLGLELGKKERVAHEHLVEMTARHYVVLTFHGVDALICFILINNYNQLSFSATPSRGLPSHARTYFCCRPSVAPWALMPTVPRPSPYGRALSYVLRA
jgi:hypothetical protein